MVLWIHFHDIFEAFRARDWHLTDLLNTAIVPFCILMGLQALVQPAIRVEDGKVHFLDWECWYRSAFPLIARNWKLVEMENGPCFSGPRAG